MSSMENPFVHFNKVPDDTDICFTGKENVNPSSLLLSNESSEISPSLSMNSFNDEAIKSNRSCKQLKHISFHDSSTLEALKYVLNNYRNLKVQI